jgi:hypothetical protein
MKKTPAFEDVLRVYTAEGERVIPLSQVRAVLRKSPANAASEASRIAHFLAPQPAVGIELRNGEIVWSDGESDWYYSGSPSRVGR